MTIHLKRLDFSSTVSAMICVCMRHAARADGATQQALDEVAAMLNDVAGVVGRRRLATILDGPIPPVADLHQVGEEGEEDEGDEGEEGEEGDEGAKRWRSPHNMFPDLNAVGKAQGLTRAQADVLDYIRANPGCTADEISAGTGRSRKTVQVTISAIRKSIPIASSSNGNKVAGYRVEGDRVRGGLPGAGEALGSWGRGARRKTKE